MAAGLCFAQPSLQWLVSILVRQNEQMTSGPHNASSKWDAIDYTTTGAFVPTLGAAVLELLDPQPGERILDVGCGDGLLTAQIAEVGADVTGVDASAELLTVAKSRGLNVQLGDAARLSFSEAFDAVFSNAALHWMLEYDAVAAGMFAALVPGGRLAVEFGGFGNIAAIRTALAAVLVDHGYDAIRSDQFYPRPEQYTEVLTNAGFVDINAELIARPTPLSDGIVAWLRTFRSGLLDTLNVPQKQRDEIFAETAELLAPALLDSSGGWWADYVRIRVNARRPD